MAAALGSRVPALRSRRTTTRRGGARRGAPACRASLLACHGGAHLSAERKAELEAVCAQMATPGKGITACDEGPATIGARLADVGVGNDEETRRRYRQMLFQAPGANDYLCAAILVKFAAQL